MFIVEEIQNTQQHLSTTLTVPRRLFLGVSPRPIEVHASSHLKQRMRNSLIFNGLERAMNKTWIQWKQPHLYARWFHLWLAFFTTELWLTRVFLRVWRPMQTRVHAHCHKSTRVLHACHIYLISGLYRKYYALHYAISWRSIADNYTTELLLVNF